MKDMKVYVSLSAEGNVLLMVPVNKAVGIVAETKVMTARLYTKEEIEKEVKDAMQLGCHTYERVNRRVRQKR